MTVGPLQRPERVARRRLPRRGHPQDLAPERPLVLGEGGVLGFPRRRIQEPVRPEPEPTAVVVHVVRDPGDEDLGRAELLPRGLAGVVGDRGDPVVRRGREVHVDQSVVSEGGRHRNTQEAALTSLRHVGHGTGDGAEQGDRARAEIGGERPGSCPGRTRAPHRRAGARAPTGRGSPSPPSARR